MSHTDPDAPFGRTANGWPVPGAFTGTIPAFLDWLTEHLSYGGVTVSEPEPDEFRAGRMIRKISLVTAGYSDDEALLGRVGRGSLFSLRFWESDHRGGLSVYHVPVDDFESKKETTWLDEPSDTFERLYRVRSLVIDTGHSSTITFGAPTGVTLSLSEPNREISNPRALLRIDQIPLADVPEFFTTYATPSRRSR